MFSPSEQPSIPLNLTTKGLASRTYFRIVKIQRQSVRMAPNELGLDTAEAAP
jgi:hypothetical protein